MLPDPAKDRVVAVCYAVHDDLHYYASDKAGVKGESILAARGVITLSTRGLRGSGAGSSATSASTPASKPAGNTATNSSDTRRPQSRFMQHFGHVGSDSAKPRSAHARDGDKPSATNDVRMQDDQHGPRTAHQALFGPEQENFMGLGHDVKVERAGKEEGIFKLLGQLFRLLDPDIVVGYEVQNGSLGYLLARGQVLGVRHHSKLSSESSCRTYLARYLQLSTVQDLSRIPQGRIDHRYVSVAPQRVCASMLTARMCRHGADQYGARKASGIWLSGRIILNVWRLMRSELKLPIYTFENVVYNALHKRTPKYSAQVGGLCELAQAHTDTWGSRRCSKSRHGSARPEKAP